MEKITYITFLKRWGIEVTADLEVYNFNIKINGREVLIYGDKYFAITKDLKDGSIKYFEFI